MFVDFGVSLPLYLFLLLSSSVYLSVCFILCMSLLVSLSLCLSVLLYFFLVFYISFCFALFLSLSISACFVFPPLLCLYQCISFSLPPSLCFCPPTRLSLCLSFFLCSIPLYACLCLSIFLCTIFSASPSLSLFPLSVGLSACLRYTFTCRYTYIHINMNIHTYIQRTVHMPMFLYIDKAYHSWFHVRQFSPNRRMIYVTSNTLSVCFSHAAPQFVCPSVYFAFFLALPVSPYRKGSGYPPTSS